MSLGQSDSDSLIGLTVDNGRFEIIKLIGEGGMGRVFKARQISVNRMVALKVLRAQLATDANLLARFEQEAQSISRLRHPNTITVFDYGRTEDGYLFIAMELLGGTSLFSLIKRGGPISVVRTLHILDQVCGAVAEAHHAGVVHRDLKPENIQIEQVATDPDFAKVLDFGIAKITQGDKDEDAKNLTLAGAIFGTPHYMSPEQVHGHKIDHRTDLYSLGIILYEMLTGTPPFDGATPMAVMMAQASKPAPDIRESHPELPVPDALAELIQACLMKDPTQRIESADAMQARLREIMYEFSDERSGLWSAPSGLNSIGRHASQNRDVRPSGAQPSQAAHVTTRPPPGEDDDLDNFKTGGAGKWIAAALLAAALGGGAWFMFREAPAPAANTTQTGDLDPVRIEMHTKTVLFVIESDPAGAIVYLGEKKMGRTPLQYACPAGETQALVLKRDLYAPYTLEITGEGEPPQKRLIELVRTATAAPEPKAWVEVASIPSGAKVFHGDEEIGVTPFEWRPPVAEAPVKLAFRLAGYIEGSEQVTLAAENGAPLKLSAQLKGKRTRRPWKRPAVKKPAVKKPVVKKPTPSGYERL